MNMVRFSQKCFLFLRSRLNFSPLKSIWWRVQGATFDKTTVVPPSLYITWPHQVSIGKNCLLESDIFFKYDGIWQPGPSIVVKDNVFIGRGCEFNIRKGVTVGDNCLIASGCKFIDHDHGIESGRPMNVQEGPEAAIMVGEGAWLGVNVVVLKGVTIGCGAVVGAGAVVTKSVGAGEIWAGVPARRIGMRETADKSGSERLSSRSQTHP